MKLGTNPTPQKLPTFISSRARPPAWGKIRTVRPVASVEIPDMLAFQCEFKV